MYLATIQLLFICGLISLTFGDTEKVFVGNSQLVDYDTAASKCTELTGGQLATWDNENEYNKIVEIRNEMGKDVWVGLNDINQEGKWRMIDGGDCGCDCDQITQWSLGEPNDFNGGEDVAKIWPNGKLNDVPKTDINAYVCEFTLQTATASKVFVGVNNAVNYDTAVEGCSAVTLNGYLATWDDQTEYELIDGIRSAMGVTVWIGLNDFSQEGRWQFIDGDTSYCDDFDGSDCDNIPQWAPGEPNDYNGLEDAASIHDWGLNDNVKTATNGFVCEFNSNLIRKQNTFPSVPYTFTSNPYQYYNDLWQVKDMISFISILFNFIFVFGFVCYGIKSLVNKSSSYSKVKVVFNEDDEALNI